MRFLTARMRRSWLGPLGLFALATVAIFLSAPLVGAQPSRSAKTKPKPVIPVHNQTVELAEAANLFQTGRLEEAEAAVRKVIAIDSRNAEAHSLLGAVLDQRGLATEAEREYQAALLLKPNSVTALANLGVLLARTNRTADAIQRFQSVLRLDPQHATAVYNLGALYAARGEYKLAIPLLEKAAGIVPGKNGAHQSSDAALRLTLLNAYVHADRRQDALELSRSVEQSAGSDPRTMFTLALSLAEAREYAEAVRLFKRTNDLRPQTYEVLYNLGLALYNLDQFDEAIQTLASASAIAPTRADPHYRLGLIASAQGDTKAALIHWTKALELQPARPSASCARARRVPACGASMAGVREP